MSDDLRFPIGKFVRPAAYTPESRAAAIAALAGTPAALRAVVAGLTDAQLDTPYRPDGWTVRQVVHHVPDSHLNAYVRLKLALTEDAPTIKPYDEEAWARLEDTRTTQVGTSLALLEAVHDRMDRILRAMAPADFARDYVHPELGRNPLDFMVALYAWHGPHHVAHIQRLRERMGW